jgi:hypothetical protein
MNQLIHGDNLENMQRKALDNEGLEAIEVLKIKVNGVVERVINKKLRITNNNDRVIRN